MKRLLMFPALVLWRAFLWTYDRATWQYDVLVLAILAFIWLTPPDWLGDPTAIGRPGLIEWVLSKLG